MDKRLYHDDDLTAIKGIRETRQQWFRDAFNVHTFADLAALSVEEIEAKLKSERQIASRSRIEGWIAEARRFADNPGEAAARSASPVETWTPVASFVVEFQRHETGVQTVEWRTRVQHIEVDNNKTWTGIEHDELCRWMTEQLGQDVPVEIVQPVSPQSQVEPHLVAESLPDLETILELAKQMVQQSSAESDNPAVQSFPTAFSPRLQQALNKTTHFTSAGSVQPVPPVQPAAETVPLMPPVPFGVGPGEFSDTLRKKIAKARRLASV